MSCVRMPIEECKCGPVELVFVLDSSESIGLESFSLSKEFIIHTLNRVVANGNVKPENEGSHITVVQYSHGKMQELVSSNKSSIQSFNDLKREIKSLRWMAGGTFTGEALEVTRRRLSDSALASRAAVVLTDGNSDTLRDPTPLNSLCQLPGMRVSAVGIGSFFKHAWNEEGLKELSCDADGAPGVVLTTSDHAGLVDDDLLARVVDFACRDKKCPDFKCSIEGFKGPTDLLMLLDGSSRVGPKNFQNTKVAAKHIADLLLSSRTGNVTRVSVAQYSGSGPEQVDVAFSGEQEVVENGLREIQYSGDPAPVDLAATMSFAQKYLKETVRDETRQQALVFTDGCTEGGEDGNKRLSEQAAEMLKTGMLIFAVAVGEGLSQDGLLRLVSGQNESTILGSTIRTEDRIITVSGYATLKLDITCRKIARTISTQQPRVGGQE
ncbi:collagen alpha-1(VI) chain-like isoform X1 [Lethenteron reissneri]|uniref:collagen alpha-1(VI) chain-like isoform X1 n=1 Tax=Lethenteron reissneri TaxID=7753 RepID=UPI002AB6B9F8|nr:collagen alpha-1(VI) chain-like isoform X1 [Lethenteron reissneri]